MTRLTALNPAETTGKAKTLLDAVQSKIGMTPNLMRTMANAPAVLEGYLNFSGALASGTLNAKLRELIALTVADANSCEYCLAAHTAIGKMVGLNEGELVAGRQAGSSDPKIEAALKFAHAVTINRGEVSDEEFARVRQAGFTDGEIAEIVANVALNIFTNYFNHIARTEVDFPKVALRAQTA